MLLRFQRIEMYFVKYGDAEFMVPPVLGAAACRELAIWI